MRIVRRLAFLLLAFVVLFAVGILFFLPTERIVAIAVDRVKTMTGRTLTVSGEVSPTFWPVIGVSTGPVTLSNADWAEAPVMVSAEGAEIGVRIMPLLSGQVRISRLNLVAPNINLEIGEDGTPNWEFAADDDGGDAGAAGGTTGEGEDPLAALRTVSLAKAVIENGAASYVDRTTGDRFALSAINLTAAFPGLNEAFSAEGSADWNGLPAELSLRLETPEAALTGGRVALVAALTLAEAKASFDGQMEPPAPGELPFVNGRIELVAANPAGLMKKLGLSGAPPEIAEIAGVDLDGSLVLTPERVESVFAGEMTFRGKPMILRVAADSGGDWMQGGPVAFDVSVRSDGFVEFSGKGETVMADGAPGALDATVALAAPDPAALAAFLGAALPAEAGTLANAALTLEIDAAPDKASARFDGGVNRDGERLTVAGNAAGGADWMAGGDVTITSRIAAADLFALALDGTAALGDGPGFQGAVDFDGRDLKALADWAGVPMEAPGGVNSARIVGDLSADAGAVRLTGAEIALGDIRARGDLGAEISGKPVITARLAAERLDLRPFMAEDGGSAPSSGGGGDGGESWSREPIDLSALKSVDADIALTAPAIILPDFEMGETALTATLRNGALALDLEKAAAFGGGVAGVVRLDAGSGEVAADIDAAGMRLLPLLTTFAGIDRIEGTGAFSAKVTSRGESLHAIMNGLNGSGAIDLRDGTLIGVNLAAMVRNATGAFQGGGETASTDFSSVTGTYTIRQGVLSNSDLAFLGPLLRIAGEGEIGLGARNINYRMTPKAVATLEGQGGAADAAGLTFPVLITGPWSDPRFAPDLGGAIEGLLKDPDAAAKQVEGLIGGAKNLDAGSVLNLLGGGAAPAEEGEAPAEGGEAPAEGEVEAPAPAPETKDPIGGLLKGLLKP